MRRVVYTALATLVGLCLGATVPPIPDQPVWQFLLPALCGAALVLFVHRPEAFLRAAAALAVIGIGLSAHRARLTQSAEYTGRSFVFVGSHTVSAPACWHSDLTRIYARGLETGDGRPESAH